MRIAELEDYIDQEFSDNMLDELDDGLLFEELLDGDDIDVLQLNELKHFAPQLYQQRIAQQARAR